MLAVHVTRHCHGSSNGGQALMLSLTKLGPRLLPSQTYQDESSVQPGCESESTPHQQMLLLTWRQSQAPACNAALALAWLHLASSTGLPAMAWRRSSSSLSLPCFPSGPPSRRPSAGRRKGPIITAFLIFSLFSVISFSFFPGKMGELSVPTPALHHCVGVEWISSNSASKQTVLWFSRKYN
jgi:hypothetical protein